jgi:hypothetical protein
MIVRDFLRLPLMKNPADTKKKLVKSARMV